MKKLLYIISLFAIIGCYSNNCPSETTVTCNCYFYNMDGTALAYPYALTVYAYRTKPLYTYILDGDTVTSPVEVPKFDTLGYAKSVSLQRCDSTLINQQTGAKYVSLQVSYFKTMDTLLFKYANIKKIDTLFVEKESYSHVDAPECGSYRFHNIRSIRATDNAFDHVDLINTLVNYEQEANINIYFNDVTAPEE